MSDARTVSQLSLALGFSVGSWWLKLISGVTHDDKTNAVRDGMVSDAVLNSIQRNHENRRTNLMMERHGITRDPNSPNVIVVDFAHFRFVRDVRGIIYGDRRSPLASDQGVKS